MDELQRSLAWFRPELALTAGLLLVVLADSFMGAGRNLVLRLLTVAALGAALGSAFALQAAGAKGMLFSGMLVIDPLSAAFKLVLIAAGLLTVLAFSFRNSRELHGLGHGELYALVLALTLSSLLLAAANDMVMLYLALEMVSLTSYVMVAYLKGDRMSNEASLKYVLFGTASTSAMLYGLSLLYGMTGSTSLPRVQEFFATGVSDQNLFAVYAITLLLVVYGKGLISSVGTFALGSQVVLVAVIAVAAYLLGFGMPKPQKEVMVLGLCARNVGAALAPLFIAPNVDPDAIVAAGALGTFVVIGSGLLVASIFARGKQAGEAAIASNA